MKVYSPSDIAGLLGVQVSTLRKYSILLENAGHSFQRNNRNQRWYTDADVILLRKFISLKDNTDMKLKECADSVIQWSMGSDETLPNTVIHNDTERHEVAEIKELIYKQNDRIDMQSELLLKQNELISNLINRIDQQDEYISKQLVASKEPKEIETPKEDVPVENAPRNKKGLLARLFNK